MLYPLNWDAGFLHYEYHYSYTTKWLWLFLECYIVLTTLSYAFFIHTSKNVISGQVSCVLCGNHSCISMVAATLLPEQLHACTVYSDCGEPLLK